MPHHQPLVSICIPAYNAEEHVASTVQSVLSQTYQNLEVLVVDNASTDNTLRLVQQFNDPRLVIYRNERNIIAESNFDKCVELATGEFIALLHADDVYMPQIVEKQIQAFRDNPSIGAVFTLARNINDRDEVIGHRRLPPELRGKAIYHLPEVVPSILRGGNFFVTPSCMVRGKLYKELIPFDRDRFAISADFDMWLRILAKHPVAILEEELMCYRISNRSGSHPVRFCRTEAAGFFKVMDHHLPLVSGLLDIPRSALDKYQFQRSIDNIIRAANHLKQGQAQEARRLLKKSYSVVALRGAGRSLAQPKFLAFWVCGIVLLGSAYLGLGRYLANGLLRLMNGWKRGVT